MLVINSKIQVIDQLEFSHDSGKLYAAGSNVPDLRYKPDNRGIDIRNMTDSAVPTDRILPDQLIAGFAVNPAGGWLYVGTGYAYGDGDDASGYFAVDMASGKATRLGMTGGNAFPLAVHPSGKWFVAAGYAGAWLSASGWQDQLMVRWRQRAKSPPIKEWELKAKDRFHTAHLACDADGSYLVTHELELGRVVAELVYELQFRDPANGTSRQQVPIPGRTVDQIVFSPEGNWLVLRAGRSFLVWNMRDLTLKPRKVTGGRMQMTGIAFHPSGEYLAATSNDTTVKLYDTNTWKLATTFTWNIGRLRSIAFSPDGMLAAVGSDTGRIMVWDVDL